jgi:hypothetical protein
LLARLSRNENVDSTLPTRVDAQERTVRHLVQNSKLDRQAHRPPAHLTDHLENATTFGGVVPRNHAFR